MSKIAFVTGSSQGIGKEIAIKLARSGYDVAINCINSVDKLNETLLELQQYSPKSIAIQGDVSNYATAKSIVDEIQQKLGYIDVLVNNAGMSYIGLFNEMTPDKWQAIFNNNFYSVLNCSHLVTQNMIHQKAGVIINISSMWGSLGASCEAVYSASKGAVNSFTKALAKELAPCNIRINAISCGAIETRMNTFMTAEEKTSFTEEIPLMRFGTPEEVAELALFLASESSRYITGQIINIDGGMT